ncbi:MAG: hypothetical protein CL609_03785 [Anaerolineaceae bacterium]|nr:hypothetical protein [Anaerolineaceae bacterium]
MDVKTHMNLQDGEAKDKLISRLKRIEGQVRGIQTMVSEERNCQDILQQLTAVRSAVQSASLILLEEYMSDCVLNLDDKAPHEREALIKDMVKLLGRVP